MWIKIYIQHNLVHGLSKELKDKNVKIYEIVVAGMVKDEDENYKHTPKKIAEVYLDVFKNGIKDNKVFVIYWRWLYFETGIIPVQTILT